MLLKRIRIPSAFIGAAHFCTISVCSVSSEGRLGGKSVCNRLAILFCICVCILAAQMCVIVSVW